jgi:hypothetical protein
MKNKDTEDKVHGLEWKHRDDGTCDYCGSLSVTQLIEALNTPGTHYSGTDWKYGWPHKFYIQPMNPETQKTTFGKFYNVHLKGNIGEEIFQQASSLIWKNLHILFVLDDQGLRYSAPSCNEFYGYQTWGVIGQTTCGKCGCSGGNSRTGFCFCPDKCHPDPVFTKEDKDVRTI